MAKKQSSIDRGTAPYYLEWLAKLQQVLATDGAQAKLARAFVSAHPTSSSIPAASVSLTRIKLGQQMAGGEWQAFINHWLITAEAQPSSSKSSATASAH